MNCVRDHAMLCRVSKYLRLATKKRANQTKHTRTHIHTETRLHQSHNKNLLDAAYFKQQNKDYTRNAIKQRHKCLTSSGF